MAKKQKARKPPHANTDEHRNALPGGFRLHWYEIEQVLGQGGFGITYLAQDTNLEQAVAIKEYLPSELAVRSDDSGVHPISKERAATFAWGLERFISEGKTLAKFKHPHIVSVYSLFEANHTGYMVMAYEQGASLEALLRQRRNLPEPELLEILLPLLEGLDRVHQAGFIHRDIKPANILVRHDGTAVLIDFGSARQAFAGYTRTLTTVVSPGYAPFEQYASTGEKQGPWTDIYALGATLYRVVTGKTPADAIARNVVLMGQADPLRPATEIARGWYAPPVLAAIDCALAFLEHDRPQNVAEWRAMLLGEREVKRPKGAPAAGVPTVEATELTEATPAQATERLPATPLPAPARRRLKWLGVAALLLVVVGVVSYQFAIRQKSLPPVEEPVEQVAKAQQPLEQKTKRPVEQKPTVVAEKQEKPDEKPKPLAEKTPVEQTPKIAAQQEKKPAEGPTKAKAEGERERAIQELLAKAEANIQALRLTSPAGNNALERYRAVLALDPDNVQAQEGLQQIVTAYLRLVAKAQDAQRFDKAEQYLKRVEAIGRNAEDIQHARAQLLANKAQVERQAEIQQLLAEAQTDIKAKRLIGPKGNNALERFRSVLAIEPDNVEAKQGIARLMESHVELAQEAIAAEQFMQAEIYLNNAAAIQADAPQIHAARAQLAKRRAQAEARRKAEVEEQRKAEPKTKPKEDLQTARIGGPRQEQLINRVVRTLTGHAGPVAAVAFSPDGRTLASGSLDKTIKLWDMNSDQLRRTLTAQPGGLGGVNVVAFSPDGRTLASGTSDKKIKLWDVSSGELRHTLTGGMGYVYSVAFSPDGGTLASGSYRRNIRLWDVDNGQLRRTLNAKGFVLTVAFSPDGRTLASGRSDKIVRLWDVSSGQLRTKLKGHPGGFVSGVQAVAFSPDGRTLASAGWDKTIKLWDVSTGQLRHTLAGHSKEMFAVAFSPDGRTLASGSNDKTIKLWDTSSGQLRHTLTAHARGVTALAFSPDGRTLASGSADKTIKLWR